MQTDVFSLLARFFVFMNAVSETTRKWHKYLHWNFVACLCVAAIKAPLCCFPWEWCTESGCRQMWWWIHWEGNWELHDWWKF